MSNITLVQIDFDDTSTYFSFDGVASPSAFYEPYIENISQLDRQSPVYGEAYSIADVEITFINWQQFFTKRKGGSAPGKYFYNRPIKLLFGDEFGGVAAMTTLFQGRIQKWSALEDGRFRITARDFSYDRFRAPLTAAMKKLDTTTFPNLPVGTEPRLVPVIYGAVFVDPAVNYATYDLGCPIPCYSVGFSWVRICRIS